MKTKKVAFLGLSVALAMILSFVEHQIPPLVAVPGVKVGLPNLVIVYLLYKLGAKEAVIVSLVRIVLVSMLFGNAQSAFFSLCGAVLSLLGMILLKKLFATTTVSVVGGVLHNLGQILVAWLVFTTKQIWLYMPILAVAGTVTGVLIGVVANIAVNRLNFKK